MSSTRQNDDPGISPELEARFVTWLQKVMKIMEESHKDVPVARLPWIPINFSTKHMTDTSYYKEVMASSKNKSGAYNLELYRLLSDTMPFYLPRRYHAMDCRALQANSTNGQYWAHASHFLIYAQGHGANFWSELQENQPNLADFEYLRFVSSATKTKMFQGGLELCQSAEEFLLEPWVLVQLPWNPVLLHQWLVAVLAEYYKFYTEYAEFVHCPFPCSLQNYIIDIEKVIETIKKCLFSGFSMIEGLVKFVLVPDCSNVTNCIRKNIEELLPILKYLLSGKAMESVRALKRMSWNQEVMQLKGNRVRRNEISSRLLKIETFLYNYQFWRHANMNHIFSCFPEDGPPPKAKVDERPFMSTRVEPEWDAKMRRKYKDKVDWEEVRKFVDKKIVQTGRIMGVSREDILECVEDNMIVLFFYNQYVNYFKTCSKWGGVQQRDAGVISNILNLYSDSMCAEALGAMTNKLHFDLMVFKKKIYAYLKAVNCEGPDMCLDSIKSAARSALDVKKSQKLVGVLNVLKRGLKTTLEGCPNFDDGAEIAAALFEMRIKKIVCAMLESHFNSTPKWRRFYPEMNFVQYILPCFVVSFLDLAKDPSAKPEGKKWYMQFVHELICTFETEENYKNSSDCMVPKTHSPYHLLIGGGEPTDNILLGRIELILKTMNLGICGSAESKSQVVEEIDHKFLSVLRDMTACEPLLEKDLQKELLNLEFLYGQMTRYLTRMAFALRKTTVCNYMDLPKHKMEDAMLICMFMMKMNEHDDKVLPLVNHMCEIHNRIVEAFGHRYCQPLGEVSGGRFNSSVHKRLAADAATLSYQQLISIHMYNSLSVSKATHRAKFRSDHWDPCRFDAVEVAFSCFLENDLWKLKQILISLLQTPESKDLSLMSSLQCAKSAPLSFASALDSLSEKMTIKNMSKKGVITFFPIRHCRWCGLVNEELKMCSECHNSGKEYMDKNWFCTDECEKIAWEKVHKEEHARSLAIKSGLEV